MIDLIWDYLKPIVEILILWFFFYRMLVFLEGSRAFQVLRGIIYLLVVFFLSIFLGLHTLNWLLTKFFGISIIAILILFQQELRQGLARLGQQHLFSMGLAESEILALIEKLSSAAFKLSSKRTGSLIALERETKLKTFIESGIPLDAKLTEEVIQSIFSSGSPLHDGGVIVTGERVAAACCLFPLSENPHLSKIIGTRHRAALGMSEQSDAIVIVISEENGDISSAHDGKFIPVINKERFTNTLKGFLLRHKKNEKLAVQ